VAKATWYINFFTATPVVVWRLARDRDPGLFLYKYTLNCKWYSNQRVMNLHKYLTLSESLIILSAAMTNYEKFGLTMPWSWSSSRAKFWTAYKLLHICCVYYYQIFSQCNCRYNLSVRNACNLNWSLLSCIFILIMDMIRYRTNTKSRQILIRIELGTCCTWMQ